MYNLETEQILEKIDTKLREPSTKETELKNNEKAQNLDNVMAKLNNLVGLNNIKMHINELVTYLKLLPKPKIINLIF